jgi:hypothetical protein
VKRNNRKAKKRFQANAKLPKQLRGSLKGTKAMEVFVAEQKRERVGSNRLIPAPI